MSDIDDNISYIEKVSDCLDAVTKSLPKTLKNINTPINIAVGAITSSSDYKTCKDEGYSSLCCGTAVTGALLGEADN